MQYKVDDSTLSASDDNSRDTISVSQKPIGV